MQDVQLLAEVIALIVAMDVLVVVVQNAQVANLHVVIVQVNVVEAALLLAVDAETAVVLHVQVVQDVVAVLLVILPVKLVVIMLVLVVQDVVILVILLVQVGVKVAVLQHALMVVKTHVKLLAVLLVQQLVLVLVTVRQQILYNIFLSGHFIIMPTFLFLSIFREFFIRERMVENEYD